MHYSLSLPAGSPWPAVSIGGAGGAVVDADPRWDALVRHLHMLRRRRRRAVRIVDVDCGDGTFLIRACREARAIGFLSIEGRGIGTDQDEIEDANRHAHMLADHAFGLEFEVAEPLVCLRGEAELPADIVLYRARDSQPFRDAVKAAGDLALRDDRQPCEHVA